MIIGILIIISIIVVAILLIRRLSMIKTGNENIQDMNKQIASLTQELEEARQESKLKDVYLHNLCHYSFSFSASLGIFARHNFKN